MEKISANSDTRFSVKPQAQEANSVAASVRITAAADDGGLAPAERDEHQRDDRKRWRRAACSISFCALSLAVAP